MKKEYIILILTGVLILILIRQNKKSTDLLKPGDKGNEIFALQNEISRMSGVKFPNMGAYDNYTLDAVRYYMEGSYALVDSEAGYVDRKFASDLMTMQSKLSKN